MSTSLMAADFTVVDGQTVTTTQELSDSNDVGLIESGGTIDVSATAAVLMNSASGSITGQSCTNSGTIQTANTNVYGIYNQSGGSNATIINNGTILTTGLGSSGIWNFTSSSINIQNRGNIVTTGIGGVAIYNHTANNSSILHSGTISTIGLTSFGIWNRNSDNCSILNSGSITTTGTSGFGIYISASDLTTIKNSGTISTTGSLAAAYRDEGTNSHLINSGIIKSAQSFALNFTGTNPSLTLLRGSNLQGPVESSGDPLNVAIEKGLNVRLTITDNSMGFGVLSIDEPFITVGNTETVAAVDPTSFVMQADILEDLSDSILDSIYQNLDYYLHCCFPCRLAWGEGMGSDRKRTQDGIQTHNWQGGFLVGADQRLCDQNALGLFIGGSWGEGKVEDNTATANVESYFGGATYETLCGNTFFGMALAAGYFQSENRRIVMFNLAPNGQETAKAKAEGGMLTTEIFAARWLLRPCRFRPLISGALRYAGLFLGDYNENGSSSDLFVKDRHISLIKPKLIGAFTKSGCTCGSNYFIAPYIGVAGRFQVSGKAFDSELLGQSLFFDTDATGSIAELLYGIEGSLNRNCFGLFINLQGLRDSQNSSRFLGEAGIHYLF